jgi:thiamine pyrophosphate-dependent acetolactate synthase large subunit-like protein
MPHMSAPQTQVHELSTEKLIESRPAYSAINNADVLLLLGADFTLKSSLHRMG